MDSLEQYKNKTIVYAVLNWGLGHATRSIPIIKQLIDNNNRVILLCDGVALSLLQSELPQIEYRVTPRYKISYTTNSIWINVLKSIRSVWRAINSEKRLLSVLEKEISVDLVISDGRFGVRSLSARSVFITHQVQIYSKIKVISYLATKVNLSYINKLDECWILDKDDNSTAGHLSRPYGLEMFRYIGLSSRMQNLEQEIQYDICIVLSGLEPKRTQLEKKLNDILADSKHRVSFVRGTEEDSGLIWKKNIDYHNQLDTDKLNKLICSSQLIICRSGYSSIMDLIKLDKKAILIPTLGQTEQEYLAEYHNKKGTFRSIKENDLSSEILFDLIGQLLN